AQALGPSQALGWEQATFSRLLDEHPRLARNALHILAARVREGQDRYRELATERAEQRIAHALLRLAEQTGPSAPVTLPLTRQDVAELAGTPLFTASRTLRRWETQGLITSGRGRLAILQPAALRQLAEMVLAPSLR